MTMHSMQEYLQSERDVLHPEQKLCVRELLVHVIFQELVRRNTSLNITEIEKINALRKT